MVVCPTGWIEIAPCAHLPFGCEMLIIPFGCKYSCQHCDDDARAAAVAAKKGEQSED